jgi:hypothetical protein
MVQGLIAGLEEGWVAGASAVYSFSPSAKPYQTALKYELQFSKSFGAYVDRIDAVEADGGAQEIPLAIVMICLADKNPNNTDAWKAYRSVLTAATPAREAAFCRARSRWI